MTFCSTCGNARNECECGDRKVDDFISGFDSLMDGLDSFLGPKITKCGKCLGDIFVPFFRCSQCNAVQKRCKLMEGSPICEVCATGLTVTYLCPCSVRRITPHAKPRDVGPTS